MARLATATRSRSASGQDQVTVLDDPPPVVSVDRLTKTFGKQRGISDVTFDIAAGEVLGYLGPNGAGKSTTLRLLLGLYRPSSGQVRIFGQDPTQGNVDIRRRIGYLPGELALFPRLTGRQHLDRFSHARGLQSSRYRESLVERFGAELDRPVHVLSKGNRQKLGLILAFMHQPELLVLDEPTSGLDPLLQDEFQNLVRESVAEGRTVLLSSHELEEVQRLVDRVAIIKDGCIVVTDTVEGLRKSAPRTVEFRFPIAVDNARFTQLDGVQVLHCDGGRLVLSVTGVIAPLLKIAAELEPIDMTARSADLDELFMTYYRNTPGPQDV